MKALFIALSIIVTGAVVVLGVHELADSLLAEKAKTASTSCSKIGATHNVIIKNGQVLPPYTEAKLCDKLTIINKDAEVRLMAFGSHDNHQPYNGVTEKVLDQNQSFSVTLNQAGTFKFHDHLDISIESVFNVD